MHVIWDVNKIVSNLYQGAAPPLGNFVAERGFKTLVLAAVENQDDSLYPGVEVIKAPGEDDDTDLSIFNDTLPSWILAGRAVAKRVAAGDKVIVTCMAGLNRSGFITAIALRHLYKEWSGKQIVEHIQSRRRYALCNQLFERYIIQNL